MAQQGLFNRLALFPPLSRHQMSTIAGSTGRIGVSLRVRVLCIATIELLIGLAVLVAGVMVANKLGALLSEYRI